MASVSALRVALANTIAAVPGLRVSPTYISVVNPPQAVVMPSPGSIVEWVALGDVVNYNFRVPVLVTYAEDASSQAALDALLDESSSTSVLSVLRANPTLSGACSWAIPTSVSTYGLMEWAGVQYFGTNFMVTVAVLWLRAARPVLPVASQARNGTARRRRTAAGGAAG
jgi:hypothetical protein